MDVRSSGAPAVRVVIVHGSPKQALEIVEALQSSFAEVLSSHAETLDALRDTLALETWDAVIGCHTPPSSDLVGALGILAQHDPDLPLVLVSESMSAEALVALMRAGARDFAPRAHLERLGGILKREVREAAARRTRRADEERHREDDERRKALIEEIPALTYVGWADEVLSMAYVSPQIRAMTGFSPGEWLADPASWARQIHPEDRERVLAAHRERCQTGAAFSFE
jgi:PAS domain-containing protein